MLRLDCRPIMQTSSQFNTSHPSPAGPRWAAFIKGAAPGLALAAAVAYAAALGMRFLPLAQWGLGTLSLAILLGMLVGNTVAWPHMGRLAAGLGVARKNFLQLGVALYGMRLMLKDVLEVGWLGVLLDLGMLASTFALAVWLGTRWLGLERNTAVLIGAGNAICGAAAILATEPVVRGRSEQVSIAVACIVLFGTLSTFVYPWLFDLNMQHGWLAQGAGGFGIYVGATVHEVAQVVAAASGLGEQVANAAVITKMVRVMLLGPFLLLLTWWQARSIAASAPAGGSGADADRPRIGAPWFVWGFAVCVALRSAIDWPASAVQTLIAWDNALLAIAMAALGLGTQLRAVVQAGTRPLVLAAVLWLWLMGAGAALHLLLGKLLGL